MTPEEPDEARAKEAQRLWGSKIWSPGDVSAVAKIAALLARKGWKPPEPPVDPDLLAFRGWFANRQLTEADCASALSGKYDRSSSAEAFRAGARTATERERERAEVLVEYIRNHWPKGGSPVLAKYQEGLK